MIHRARWKFGDLLHCFRPGRFRDRAHHYDAAYAERMDAFARRTSSVEELGLLLEEVALDDGMSVLDLGCNTGRLGAALHAATGAVVTGIDPNEAAIARARQAYPEGEFLPYDGLRIPLRDASFHHVMINHVIGHVADPEFTLAEVCRVLSPGGSVSLVTPNRWYKLAMTVPNLWNRYTPDPTVLRFYTRRSLRALLLRHGFTVESLKTIGEGAWPFSAASAPGAMRMRVFALARKPARTHESPPASTPPDLAKRPAWESSSSG